MKFTRTVTIGGLFFLLLTICSCKKNEFLPERIIRTNLKSINTEREYKLYISLPDVHLKNKQYPVIYHLNGDKNYKKIGRSANELIQKDKIAESIIVGIGYGDNNDGSENDYLTTSTEGAPNGGNAINFHAFLTTELIPFINQEYGGNTTNNTLIGDNHGGLFAIQAFFLSNKPDREFDKFISISPSINYDDGIVFSQEIYYYSKWTDVNASISIIMGGNEESDRIMMGNAFIKKLQSRNYPSLKSNWTIIKNKSRELIVEEATTKGLKFVSSN